MRNRGKRFESEPAKPVEELFADRLKFEHEVLSQRVTWLMTLNGFLVAALGLLAVNDPEVASVVPIAILAISIIGCSSNASVLFSNWWGTQSIRAAGEALSDWWIAADLSENERETRRLRMRLYGRDPDAFHGYQRRLPTEWLHPWLFLPTLFTLAFLLMPLGALWRAPDLFSPIISFASPGILYVYASVALALLPLLVPAVFTILIFCDWHFRRQDEKWALVYGPLPSVDPSLPATITKKVANEIYKKDRREINEWVKSTRRTETLPKLWFRKPGPWGVPAATRRGFRRRG